MARSARGRIAGLNLQRLDGARLSDLNARTYVLYDESAAFAPELRQRVPDALIVLRLIRGSRWGDPEATAREGARLCREWPQVDVLCPANEQNHENDASSSAIARWCDRFNDEYAVQGAPKRTCSPALSTGKPFDLAQLQASWRRFDYVGVHGYTTLDDLNFTSAIANVLAHRETWRDKPQLLTEWNVEKLEETTYRHGEGAAACENFLNRLAALGYVEGAMWFLDDAYTDEWRYRLVRIPPLMDLFRRIGHEQSTTPSPGPTPPPSNEIARVEAIYGITHTDGVGYFLESLEERTDPPNITAVGPPDAGVVVSTNDDQHRAQGVGRAEMNFSHPAQYQPVSQGERGWYYATCGDARVDGLGWAYDRPPVMQGPHVNVVAHFAKHQAAPPRPEPPVGVEWQGAFVDYAVRHPEVGRPLGVAVYAPSDWACCIQVSATHCLVWNGWVVSQVKR